MKSYLDKNISNESGTKSALYDEGIFKDRKLPVTPELGMNFIILKGSFCF